MSLNGSWRYLAICVLILPGTLCFLQDQPKVLLVSFDGFRWDYIYKFPTPNFQYIIKNGIHVEQVTNAFITKTFPNHYTMVTGLYAESHGVVANEMYDPVLNDSFSMNHMTIYNSKFWEDAYPIWITNQMQGHRSGAAMWPGTDVKIHGVFPTHYMPYNESVTFQERVAKLIEWFRSKEPINLGLLYWEQPDELGHILGPDNPLMEKVIRDVDDNLGYLVSELKRENLWDTLNVIITSDHGMAQNSRDRIIELDLYVDRELYRMIDHSPTVALLPEEGKLDEVYSALVNAHPHMSVYKKEDIPNRLHYKHSSKIQPILAVADEGWEILQNKSDGFVWGDHGYDNVLPEMHPIFLALGPAFRRNFSKQAMNSTDLYPLLCYMLGIDPLPNNGSLESMKDALVNPVHEASQPRFLLDYQQASYAYFIGVILGSTLVLVFLLAFVRHLTYSQTPAVWGRQTEVTQPLLQP
nr:ectonucleotide pyrophosphatase/phosphodiesterase family member 5 isoform X1 [Pogona vitticeps]XP_020657162.1 ectonucleotide pyrophosphatase/phosphodiesterase family member 5 isoform X1 [Pogona vitticeps]XP_020657163.1 ectonucleotide pyrophosphatase/phosphodiesterase family member 5 isoform X1 [Pogona vitticeps]XP_020657164.1 ectonucleotide pyrophosphatase/phosphodiesterase family member 5 isoform X1 [Pogona vitticeps]XP_020657165.1 ectonucleotide pyrophosphatase/phosphodiesterase family memb